MLTPQDTSAASLTLKWSAVSDYQTGQAGLKYYVFRSASDNIATVTACENNGTLLNANGTFDITSYAVTGLAPNTTYWFNVVVADAAGNKTAYKMVSVTTAPQSAPATETGALSGADSRRPQRRHRRGGCNGGLGGMSLALVWTFIRAGKHVR